MWAELLLIIAATAAFAVWQWRDLARERRRNAEAKARQRAEEDLSGASANSVAAKGGDPGSTT